MTTTTTVTNLGQTIKKSAMAVALCASLAIGTFGLTATAEARVPDDAPGSDHANHCRLLQGVADGIRNELSNPNTTAARRTQLQAELGRVQDDWARDCKGTYGSIFFLTAGSQANLHNLTDNVVATQGGNSQPGTKVNVGKSVKSPGLSAR